MIELKEYNEVQFVSAKEIHKRLGQTDKNFNQWIKRVLLNTPFRDGLDFSLLKRESTGGRPATDYLLKEQTAISVIMMSGGKDAHKVRLEIAKAFFEKEKGVLMNADQVGAITDISFSMTLVSVQKESERRHYDYLNKPKDWYKYRAELLGYSTESLKTAMAKVNKKYKSQKKSLVYLNPIEVIRTGVIDLLMALGKNKEYALNVAEFAKVIAEKNNYHLQIWDDTKGNPLKLNSHSIDNRKETSKELNI